MTDRPNNQDAEVSGSVHPSEDELSAYINGDIPDLDELQRLQAHFATCANCRERLSELRAVVWLLRRAENPAPSRSFRLTPSMVSAPVVRIDPWIVRVQPALRRLTAIAAVFLLFLVVADVLTHQNAEQSGTRSVAESASTSYAASGSSALSVAPASAESNGAGSAAQPNVANAAATSAGAAAAADTAKSHVTGTPVAAATTTSGITAGTPFAVVVAPPESTGQSLLESPQAPGTVSRSGTSYWRLIELAAGVVVIWLLFLTFALPQLVRQREP